ncbi:D111/G-patch domain protein [Cordyceps fumosorosea ARSEF 2679]|uniref:Protein SQS1 n=1 Tax=Cordyceps fumosorosea (strain ARSEF 2679) TaxID=1081104 RepID=A0A168EG08_CORFA|nr:D111/G-patch domain protein [Cordyceps fumosorosea ARSEF 2679]OAA73765.1 D111/G-patch domain protein [Cordyceps fumosorosea ARSEF 2679]
MARKSKNKKKGGLSPGVQTPRAPEAHPKPTIRSTSNYSHHNEPASRANHAADGFTLADEARQTSQHDHSFWSQATKLRLMPISFISAGMSEPLKAQQYTETDEYQSDTTPIINAPKVEIEADQHQNEVSRCSVASGQEATPSSEAAEPENNFLYYDTGRGSPVPNQTRSELSTPQTQKQAIIDTEKSDSEGEIILFKGRLNTKNDAIDMEAIRTEIHVVEQQIERNPDKLTAKNRRGRRGGRQAKAKRAVIDAADEDDGMLADYIANMRENDEFCGLLQTAAVTIETDDQSEGSEDSSDDENDAAESPAEAIIATQLKQHTPSWTSGESGMEYTDFDTMDWERPSLRQKKGKGAKQNLDLRFADLDPETERRLQAAWHSDRLRKAERKKEREQLRALNLIGKKGGSSDTEDLRIKYPKGMSLQQIADELQKFLMSIDDSICLPPMDKRARKMIHELANKFNVKSKSIGKADQRRPTLYRTKRTPNFDEEVFDLAVRRIQRRYFPRLDYKGKSSRGQSSRNGYAEASYRDGEIVGASAPELSTENRGRAMLEKMGWSTGTALGSADNKGILLPVTQTMKRSKAGLG